MTILATLEKVRKIIDSYDDAAPSEINEVERIGKKIIEEMDQHRWLTWTAFPKAFFDCHTESQLHQTVNNFNGWLKETGIKCDVGQKEQSTEQESDSATQNNYQSTQFNPIRFNSDKNILVKYIKQQILNKIANQIIKNIDIPDVRSVTDGTRLYKQLLSALQTYEDSL